MALLGHLSVVISGNYSLSKKRDIAIRKYEHNGNWLQIIPSAKGLATIYDKDILIYCISQIMEKLKRKEPVGQRIRITSYDLLVFTNRGTSGRDYDALCEAIDRLAGTAISHPSTDFQSLTGSRRTLWRNGSRWTDCPERGIGSSDVFRQVSCEWMGEFVFVALHSRAISQPTAD